MRGAGQGGSTRSEDRPIRSGGESTQPRPRVPSPRAGGGRGDPAASGRQERPLLRSTPGSPLSRFGPEREPGAGSADGEGKRVGICFWARRSRGEQRLQPCAGRGPLPPSIATAPARMGRWPFLPSAARRLFLFRLRRLLFLVFARLSPGQSPLFPCQTSLCRSARIAVLFQSLPSLHSAADWNFPTPSARAHGSQGDDFSARQREQQAAAKRQRWRGRWPRGRQIAQPPPHGRPMLSPLPVAPCVTGDSCEGCAAPDIGWTAPFFRQHHALPCAVPWIGALLLARALLLFPREAILCPPPVQQIAGMRGRDTPPLSLRHSGSSLSCRRRGSR